MKILLPFTMFLLGFNSLIVAQTLSNKIKGSVVDEKSAPIPFVSLVLADAMDSSFVDGQTANEKGEFYFDRVRDGLYIITASMIGYQNAKSAMFKIESCSVQLPTLHLLDASRNLQEVTVVAKKPFIDQLEDRTIINVGSSITSTGSSALQILEKAPGISVNAHQEQIELMGKSSPLVMIDGKPTYLSQSELFNLLKNTPGENIEKIELITHPPSKYDAAGNSGIINLIFRKEKRPGTSGNMMVSNTIVSHGYGRGAATASIDHGISKVHLFASVNGLEGKGFSQTNYDRIITSDSTKLRFDQTYGNTHWIKTYGYRSGIDYSVSTNTNISARVYGSINRLKTLFKYSDTKLYNEDLTLERKYYTHAHLKDSKSNFNANVSFKHLFDNALELTADLDYMTYGGNKINHLSTEFYKADDSMDGEPEIVRNTMPLGIRIGLAKTDFTKKIGKYTIEGGLKTSVVKADNAMKYETFSDHWEADSSRSNRFIYLEKIHAAYFSFNGQITSKTTAQIGIRTESTVLVGYSETLKQRSKRTYIRFFPSLLLSHQFNAAHRLTFSYGYRLDRPDYQLLNPFESYLDPYTTLKGNPYLTPQYTRNFQLVHLFRSVFNTTLAYSDTRNLIVKEFPFVDKEDQKLYLMPSNMDAQRSLNIILSAPLVIATWWNAQINISTRVSRYLAFYRSEQFNLRQTTFTLTLGNSFVFSKNWSGEINGNFASQRLYGLINCRPTGSVGIGVQRTLCKKKIAVQFTGQDIFWTNVFDGSSHFSNLDFTVKSVGVSQTFTLSCSYKFGNVNTSKQKTSSNSALEFQKRASGSN